MHNKKLLLLLVMMTGCCCLGGGGGGVLDDGGMGGGWVLHWDDVHAGCCMDRTGMMIRWGCAEKNGEGPPPYKRYGFFNLTFDSYVVVGLFIPISER